MRHILLSCVILLLALAFCMEARQVSKSFCSAAVCALDKRSNVLRQISLTWSIENRQNASASSKMMQESKI